MPMSENAVIMRDENFAKKAVSELLVKLSSERMTARELISARVRTEAALSVGAISGNHRILVEPTAEEKALNSGVKEHTVVGVKEQILKALTAFEDNVFFLLVDDKQIGDLEDIVVIRPDAVVTFLRLTPLKGG
jgi:hypothetical protein